MDSAVNRDQIDAAFDRKQHRETGRLKTMAYSPYFVRRIAQVLNALFSTVLVVNLGIGPLLATLLAGFLISCWAFVYAHVMCAGEHLQLQEMAWTAAWGACTAPVVVLLHIALGSAVVVPLIVCAALWIAAVTPTGHPPAALTN